MEYTVNKLAGISGVTTRTLRYYDEIGLLKPARINSSGYRIYGRNEVHRLQQILFFRALDITLDEIKLIMMSEDFDEVKILNTHYEKLMSKRAHLDLLINNVKRTIEEAEGRTRMSDKEKFEGLKKNLIDENESKYGDEIRRKYGEETVNRSNEKFAGMSEETYNHASKLAEDIIALILKAMDENDTKGETAMMAAEKHKEWLMVYWNEYSKEAHAGLGDMYVADERFTHYYDQHRLGAAKFFCEVLHVYTGV
ncbi:MerR family transcriptional regulator [Fusibacter bizertensis]